MLQFIARRAGIMILTALCLTFVVFFLTNLYPNLEKLAKTQGNFRMSEEQVNTWLNNRGYGRNMIVKYGEWLGVVPGYVIEGTDGEVRARCARKGTAVEDAPTYCGILQGDWGYSTVSKDNAGPLLWNRLKLTGFLMMWALIITVPIALMLGIFAGMKEGLQDRPKCLHFLNPFIGDARICLGGCADSHIRLECGRPEMVQGIRSPGHDFTEYRKFHFAGTHHCTV